MGGWGLARKRGVDRANEGVVMVVVFLQHDEGSFCVMISSVEYLKKKLYGTFLWMGFNCLKATATSRRQFTFYHSVPRNSWYSFYQPRKDEKLSRPWSHPVVLSMGLLAWESSILTTRPLLHKWNGALLKHI